MVFAINLVPNLGKISKSILNSFNESISVWNTQLLLALVSSAMGRRIFLGTISEIFEVKVILPGFKSAVELNKLMNSESVGKINSTNTFCSKKLCPYLLRGKIGGGN